MLHPYSLSFHLHFKLSSKCGSTILIETFSSILLHAFYKEYLRLYVLNLSHVGAFFLLFKGEGSGCSLRVPTESLANRVPLESAFWYSSQGCETSV